MPEYRTADGREVWVKPNGDLWRSRDLRWCRLLGEELRANGAHETPWGSLAHDLALQAAARKATERMETGT